MHRPALEVADIFRDQGPAWRDANRGHVSLDQLKVMSAIERCRTAALGGHVLRCENDACGYTAVAYNSCRNRHCPKCQGAAAQEDGGAGGGAFARAVLPRRVHAAVGDRRYRVSQQGGDLRSAVAGVRRDDAHDRRRSQASGGEDCDHLGAAHLGKRKTVTFKVKDYRIDGPGRYKTMTLDAHEFIRRFLIHVLPTGFHRIRHYGLLASGVKADNLALARKLLNLRRRRLRPRRPCPIRLRPISRARAARGHAHHRGVRGRRIPDTGRPRCAPSGSTPREIARHSRLLQCRSHSPAHSRPR